MQSINAGAAGARISCDGVAGSDRVIRGRPPAQPGLPDAETLASQDVAGAVPSPPAPPPMDADTVDSEKDAASRRFGETLPDATTPTTRAGARVIGASLGRYVLLAKLGEGGMGEVYSGYDQELNRRVALKVVRSRRADDVIGRARTQREAQALARLSHPNVVQVHDVGEMGGELFVAMEYVEGETLRAWQRRHDPATSAGRRAILDMYMQAGRGLAAAHDAGIVHRDFKPDNVLVGDDGRARVLDFGLAAEDSVAAAEAVETGERHALLDRHLTRAGAILGTPGYMAPEQFLAQPVDRRTDVFAFSVALYEALHGELPFAGDTFAARKLAVVDGSPREPPPAARIPAWLRVVITRGLARDPAARHPSVAAMLAALQDDPIERGRRRWRLVGLIVAALALTSGLLLAGQWTWDQWQRIAAEARATERLVAIEARIDAAFAAGATDEAEQLFTTFVGHPDNRGSAALGRAWLHRAERARRRQDTRGALDAFAGAYVVATTADDQQLAQVGLARIFRDEMRWRGLALILSQLAARRAGVADAAELGELRLDAALARRDLAGAAALLRGPLAGSPRAPVLAVLTALQPTTETPHRHRGAAVVADLDGDGRLEIALETDTRERQIAPLLRAKPGLGPIGSLDLDRAKFRALAPGPGQPALLVASESRTVDGESQRDAVVRSWRDGAPVELLRWREDGVISALAADVDGDGVSELFVGTGPYTRHVRELLPGPDGSWSTRAAAPDIDRRGSDVVDLLADDLDGDGTTEVIAALGPWRAYELMLLRHDPGTEQLRMFTRHRLGNIVGAATIRRGLADAGSEVVVSKSDDYRNAAVFPRDRPNGEAAGVYLFALRGDTLVQTAFMPAPRVHADARVAYGRPFVGDLDGDGRDELIVGSSVLDTPSAWNGDTTTIFVTSPDGAIAPLVLGDLQPIAVLDLDGDGDDEVIASSTGLRDAERVWVLGSGAATLPTNDAVIPGPGDAAAPADPVLADMWRHADELAQMGLARQAAESLVTVADLVAEPELRARALLRAAELHESLGADARAAELFARAADGALHAGPAHAGAARCFLRLGRIDSAAVQLAAASRDGLPLHAVAAGVAALSDEGIDLEFDRPLAPTWRIAQPLALRRDGASGALQVDALVLGELASAPIEWSGRSVSLAVDLDLAQLEWRSGLELGLVRDGSGLVDGSSPLGIEVTTSGGGSERTHEFACMCYGRRSFARVPFMVGDRRERLGRVTIRATLLPELGEWTCTVEQDRGATRFYARNLLPHEAHEDGPLRLVINASHGPRALARAEIQRIELRGARLAATPGASQDLALSEAGRALVEDDPLAALAALARVATPSPADRLLGVVALARLGRWREAEQGLAPLLADKDSAAGLSVTLAALLRSEPEVFGALVRGAAGPAELRRRLADAWFFAVMMERDPRAFAVVAAGLAERDLASDPFDVLKLHAVAAAALGHMAAAQESYRAALVAIRDPTRAPDLWAGGLTETEAGVLHLELAALALAAGDEDAARRELRPFLARADADLAFIDRLRARDDLRALWDLAPE